MQPRPRYNVVEEMRAFISTNHNFKVGDLVRFRDHIQGIGEVVEPDPRNSNLVHVKWSYVMGVLVYHYSRLEKVDFWWKK